MFLLSHLFYNVHSELIWLIEFQNKMTIVIIGFFAFWIYLRFMKYRFETCRLGRYWFRLFTRPWLDTDIHNKHFICLQGVFKTSLRHVFKTSSRHVFKTSSRHVFKASARRLQSNNVSSPKTTSRRLQDVLWDVFKMFPRRLQDVYARRLEHVL